jgi:hypothetical protein
MSKIAKSKKARGKSKSAKSHAKNAKEELRVVTQPKPVSYLDDVEDDDWLHKINEDNEE